MIYAGLAGRLARRPVMWHVRVADPEPGLDRMLFALAQAVIVNSMAVGRRFPHPSHAKVHVIHNGVDLAHFSPRQPPLGLRSSLGISAGARIVGSVGRFVPYKGYSHLLEAARLVEHALPDTHWILVGDGEERPNLETQARKQGMQRQIHFAGWREDIPEILSLCDVFALPSLAEHFGRVLIEAMAMGKAVVATNAGGVPEIVTHGETGLLIPPGNSTALAEALLTLLQDPSLSARLGLAARRRAEACFSLSRHVEAVESVYRKLSISRHGRV
jgi:glycosyltransferase involved in cell wall biosynthesis